MAQYLKESLNTEPVNITSRIITKRGPHVLVNLGPVWLVDVIMSNTGRGQVSLIASDGEHTAVIAVLNGPGNFNHAFAGGWIFWKESKLILVKENDDGQAHIAVGWTRSHRPLTYDQWSRQVS